MSDARAERKRKRRNDSDEGLSKKIATQEDAQNILVSLVDVDEEWTPVIGMCFLGASLIKQKSYASFFEN